MTTNLPTLNQIEHDTARCDCEMCGFAKNSAQKRVKTRSEATGPENQPAGFLALEPENVSEPILTQSSPIPAPRDHVLYVAGQDCQVFHSEDRQCPVCDGGLAVCKNCKEYEAGLDNPCKPPSSTPSTPTFTHEWEAAPRSMTNYVEQAVAEWWFIRGQRAGELQSLTETTAVFRAMAERRGLG